MKTYTFPLQFEHGHETVTVTEEELRAAGWFKEDATELSRYLILWEIADARMVEA